MKRFVAFQAVFLLAISSLGSQERPGTPILVPGTETEIVFVDLVATHKTKEPVRDLTREDLVVREDGRPVEITHFVFLGAPPPGETQGALPGEKAATPKELPPERALSVVLFVDDNQMLPGHRNSVLKALQKFSSERLTSSDQVMLIRNDAKLQILTPFTHNLERIDAAIESLKKSSATGANREMERQSLLNDYGRVDTNDTRAVGPETKELLARTDTEAQVEYTAARRSLLALQQVVGLLAGVPGRKAFVYASEGLPRRPGEDLYRRFQAFFPTNIDDLTTLSNGTSNSVGNEIDALVAKANGARVTFYTINASGPTFGVSADDPSADGGPDKAAFSADADVRSRLLAETMIHFAEATGGLALHDNLSLDQQLSHMASDFSAGYVIGYSAPRHGDGKAHKISISTARKDVVLRYREGYKDKNDDERAGDQVVAALFSDPPNPLGVKLTLRQQGKDKTGRSVVSLLVEIPFDAVRFEEKSDGNWGHLHLFVAARDEQGDTSTVESRDVPLRVPKEKLAQKAGGALGYPLVLALAPGPHKVALVARDDVAGTVSATSLEMVVTKTP